jgi:hypothetical protein
MQLVIFLPTFNAPCMRLMIRCDEWKRKYLGYAALFYIPRSKASFSGRNRNEWRSMARPACSPTQPETAVLQAGSGMHAPATTTPPAGRPEPYVYAAYARVWHIGRARRSVASGDQGMKETCLFVRTCSATGRAGSSRRGTG